MSDCGDSPYRSEFLAGCNGSTHRVKRRKGVNFVFEKNGVEISPQESVEKEAIEALDDRKRRMVDDRKEYKSDVRNKKGETNKMRTAKCNLEKCAAELGKPCCNLGHMT